MIYLYVKRHAITGLKYFGKTTKSDPCKYPGSGSYWKRHINKHGKEHIETIELWQFDNVEACSAFALEFSRTNEIIESDEWANLIEENGLDGAPKGRVIPVDVRVKMSEAQKRRAPASEVTRRKKSYNNSIRKWYTNGEVEISVIPGNQPKGFIPGRVRIRTEVSRQKLSARRQGKRWFNNGIQQLLAFPDNVPEGYVKGKL